MSMLPTLADGDVLLVRQTGRPRVGALVVVRLPGRHDLAVKRLTRRDGDGWWVERDNPRAGIDSWVVGAVAPGDVVGQVVLRIWPPRRISSRPRV